MLLLLVNEQELQVTETIEGVRVREEKGIAELSEVNTRTVSRGQNALIGKFKMAMGDVISIRGQVMEYTYIPAGIRRELVRFGMDCNWKR